MREIHPYATDSPERDRWAIYIAIIATLLGYGFHVFTEAHHGEVPGWLWWVDIPGPIAVYLMLRNAMDERGWRFSLFHKLGLVRIPDLSGRWTGTLRSSYDDMATEYDCAIVIRQTWTRIAVVLTTKTSRSENLVAGVLINGVDDALLVYEYLNQPLMDAPATMEAHQGHVTLRLERKGDADVLAGEYYSGRGRLKTGTIRVTRQP